MAIQTTVDTVASVTQLVPKNVNRGNSRVAVEPEIVGSMGDVGVNRTASEKIEPTQQAGKPETGTSSGSESPSIDELTQNISDFIQVIQRDLAFSVEEETGQKIIKVHDRETGDLIRQIPSEEVVEISRRIGEQATGLLFKTKA